MDSFQFPQRTESELVLCMQKQQQQQQNFVRYVGFCCNEIANETIPISSGVQ